jgi:hypothetical protein
MAVLTDADRATRPGLYFLSSHRHSAQALIVLPCPNVQRRRDLHTALDGGSHCGAAAYFMHVPVLWKCHAMTASLSLDANMSTATKIIALVISHSSDADR